MRALILSTYTTRDGQSVLAGRGEDGLPFRMTLVHWHLVVSKKKPATLPEGRKITQSPLYLLYPCLLNSEMERQATDVYYIWSRTESEADRGLAEEDILEPEIPLTLRLVTPSTVVDTPGCSTFRVEPGSLPEFKPLTELQIQPVMWCLSLSGTEVWVFDGDVTLKFPSSLDFLECFGRRRPDVLVFWRSEMQTILSGRHIMGMSVTRATKNVYINGCIVVPLAKVLGNQMKLDVYDIDVVSRHLKVEVQADKCQQLRDMLAVRSTIEGLLELSRVTHTFVQDLVYRGPSFRSINLLFNAARRKGFVLNHTPQQRRTGYGGGTILDPELGLHKEPVAHLDVRSMYPSVMREFNLCYSTFLERDESNRHVPSRESPTGRRFATNVMGLLPVVQADLSEQRSRVREALAEEKDPVRKQQLNIRQLTLKLVANSLYGFIGQPGQPYSCVDLAASVTSYGGSILQRARTIAVARGLPVLMGVTDSIMVRMDGRTLSSAFDEARALAAEVSAPYTHIRLGVEGVFMGLLVLQCNSYRGLKFEGPEGPAPETESKGTPDVKRIYATFQRKVFTTLADAILQQKPLASTMSLLRVHLQSDHPLNCFVVSRKRPGAGPLDDPREFAIHTSNGLQRFHRGAQPDLEYYTQSLRAVLQGIFTSIGQQAEAEIVLIGRIDELRGIRPLKLQKTRI
jgi:hypothetical protein